MKDWFREWVKKYGLQSIISIIIMSIALGLYGAFFGIGVLFGSIIMYQEMKKKVGE